MGGPSPAHDVHLTPCRPALAIWPPATPPLHFRVNFPLLLLPNWCRRRCRTPRWSGASSASTPPCGSLATARRPPCSEPGSRQSSSSCTRRQRVRLHPRGVVWPACMQPPPSAAGRRWVCAPSLPPKDAASAVEGSTPWAPPWAPHSARDCHCRRCRCRLHRHRRLVLAVAGPPEHRTPGAGVGLRRPQGRGPGAGGPGVPASAAGARKREHGWAWCASQHFRFPVAKRSAARRPGLASTTQLEQATS